MSKPIPNSLPLGNRAMDRRRFLGLTGGLAAAGIVGGTVGGLSLPGRAAAQPATLQSGGQFGDPAQRTLVVVDMEGGNDALNTFVPQAGRYHDLRPTIALPDDDLLTFTGLEYGVHPSFARLQPFWDAGQLSAFYGIGLPQQSRSHFVAQDAWRSATPGVPATSGWLGRWLEATVPSAEIPLRAVSLGRNTLAAQGETGRPVAVQSVEGYQLSPPGGNTAVVDAMTAMFDGAGGLLGEAQAALPATVESVDQLQGIIAKVSVDGEDFGPDDSATLFAAAQAIIQADVGTQVIYITVGGFDTHAVQTNIQAALLESVADGLAAMFDGLAATGHADRTLALTVSEFGRRAAENGSFGTDHGNGGLAMLIGPAIAESTVHGGADLDDLVDGDLPLVLDTRSVYDNALRWLGGTSGALDGDWSSLDVLVL
ncbi:MAG: DUF1501 domain-containing protein [Actinomycetota bacterium]